MHALKWVLALLALTACSAATESPAGAPGGLTEFPAVGATGWLNSPPLRLAELRGRVVVAVHTPESSAERDRDNVVRAVRQLGIDYPVLLDAQSQYWNAVGNRYWPAFWLLDRQGRLVATAIGELHAGEVRAARFEAALQAALAAGP